MRVAHIVCTYPPYFGGMGNSAFHMAEGLSKLGHDVTVYTPYVDAATEIESQAQVARVAPTLAYGNGGFFPTITRELDQFDLVHLHYPFFGVAGNVMRWKKRHAHIPLVTTYHMDARGSGMLGVYMKWYARYYMPRVLGVSDAITASTLDFVQSSDAAAVYSNTQDIWHALPFGVDTERFHPGAVREELRYTYSAVDRPCVLFVGGMDSAHSFKGVPVLLDACRKITERGQEISLVLVGDGDLRASYEMRARMLGMGDRVYFAGSVADAVLPDYYRMADCTVLPSISSAEAFGMVLLESLASGTPVIASDLPGVREIAAIGGRVSPPGDAEALADAIVKELQTPRDMSAVQDIIATSYTWESIVAQLEGVYQSMV